MLNPASGAGRAGRAWARAAVLLDSAGHRVQVHTTSGRGDGARIARSLAGEGPAAILVVVGGDGSLNEVVNGLLTADARVGLPSVAICPVGSGNDFARSLGIRAGPKGLTRLLSHPVTQAVDAWQVAWPAGQQWFVNVASFGFTGSAAAIIDRRGKRFRGLSYVYGAMLALLNHRDRRVVLSSDAEPGAELLVGAGVLANAPWFGSAMHVAPGADTGDGRLDLVLVQGAGRLRLLGLLAGVFTGRHLRSPTVSRRLVGEVALNWEGELPFETDGEPVNVTSPATISCRPGALRFHVPPAPDR
ncbi:MAG: diacylglycerol kinase family protein [Gemmatimonadales bacterium]